MNLDKLDQRMVYDKLIAAMSFDAPMLRIAFTDGTSVSLNLSEGASCGGVTVPTTTTPKPTTTTTTPAPTTTTPAPTTTTPKPTTTTPAPASTAYPYYGTASSTATIDASLITGLANRGAGLNRLSSSFYAIDSLTTSLYYAYPVSYGLATFTDLGNGFQGGWDGAAKDGGVTLGPVTVNVETGGVMVPYYVYQADHPNISPTGNLTFWSAT